MIKQGIAIDFMFCWVFFTFPKEVPSFHTSKRRVEAVGTESTASLGFHQRAEALQWRCINLYYKTHMNDTCTDLHFYKYKNIHIYIYHKSYISYVHPIINVRKYLFKKSIINN